MWTRLLHGPWRGDLPRLLARVRLAYVAFGVTLLAAFYLDFIHWPDRNQPVVYTIPLLVAALAFTPRVVRGIAAILIVLDLIDASRAHTSIQFWPYTLLALVVTSILAISLAAQRERTTRYAREAEEARARLQRFLGMVSHDLGGPTFAIVGTVQLLLNARRDLPPERERALRTIASAASRTQRLIGDLHDAAAIGVDHFDVRPVRLNLVDVARGVVERQQATTTRHRLLLRAPGSLEGFADAGRLDQLLDNLVSNAIKYSNGGDVEVRLDRRESRAIIAVVDQGRGIPLEEQRRLFEPFTRFAPGDRPVKGNGLGLYIARAIALAHGGDISVESVPGRGSTFRVTLPLTPSEAGEARKPVGAPDDAPNLRAEERLG